ncbi:TniQ family protein [Sinorhizobium fredii]|uniref:TniQ family protein n=1 Tax=Rhizobium fredii TaxID=380 RepID=UPI0004B867E7|nr:TniQ family protein [Sinorhizobium fredii]AWI58500.1 hypothetical protein AB395_00002855 [Sinorhizobium fredii CCBAU 45436]
MTELGRLPTCVVAHDDETPESLMARTARANSFYSLAEFCDFTGTSRSGIAKMGVAEQQQIAEWTGVPVEDLARFADKSGRVVKFGKALVRKAQLRDTSGRYCPHCFAGDMQGGADRPSARIYMRATWRWSMIANCPDHEVPLLELAEDFDAVDLRDFATSQASDVGSRAPSDSDRYFARRLLGHVGETYLDSLQLYVAAELCAVLGALHQMVAEGKISDRVPGGMTNPDRLASGYRIACGGYEAIWKFLTNYVAKMVGKASKYPMVYSLPLRWLRDEQPDGDFAPMRKLFQDHAENHLPLEPGETFLTVVNTRRVHTSYSAAKEYGLPEARIRDVLLNQGDRQGVIATFGSRSIVFRKEETHLLLKAAAGQLTTTQAAEHLGCAMMQMEALFRGSYLPFSTNRASTGRVYRWVSGDEVLKFKERVQASLSTISPEHELVPILDATKICHRSFVEIISLLLNGDLTQARMSGPVFRLENIKVDPKEIDELAGGNNGDEFLDRAEAAAALGTRRETVNDLFALKIVTTTTAPHKKTRSLIQVVRPDELEKFSREHVLLDALARSRGEAALSVRRQLAQLGVHPAYEGSPKASKIYRRGDIESVGY